MNGTAPPTRKTKKLVALLANTGGLADTIAEVEELGATDVTVTDDVELGDLGRVKRESTLDADTEGDLTDGEGLTRRAAAHADDVALEDLDALAVTLLNAVVNLDVIARDDRGDILTNLLTLDSANVIHHVSLSLLPRGTATIRGTWDLHTKE